jgi:hypothetical protein
MKKISRSEAKAEGLNRYFTGKGCKRGHVAERKTHNGECTECASIGYKAYREANKEQRNEYCRSWYAKNKDRNAERFKKFKEANPNYWRDWEAERRKNPSIRIAKNARNRIRRALLGENKSANTEKLIGCTIEELTKHLERKFLPGMTWENYGSWHVDHKRPCISFDLSKPSHQRACFHFKNLQPLWARDNIAKGGRQ